MIKGLSSGISIAQTTPAAETETAKPAATPAPAPAPAAPQSSLSAAGKTALRAEVSFSVSALQSSLLKQTEAKPPTASISDAQPQPQSTRGFGFSGLGKFPTVGERGLSTEVRLDANYTKTLGKGEAKAYFLLPKTLSTGDGDDKVDIKMGGDGRVHVNVNGKEAWSGTTREFQALTIDTGGGNDVVNNEVYGAKINTGAGNDTVISTGGGSLIDVGEGDNRVDSKFDGNEIRSGSGNNVIRSEGDRNLILTGAGNDSISSVGDRNYIATGNGDDSVNLEGSDNKVRTEGGTDNVTVSNQYTDGQIVSGFYEPGRKITSQRNDVDTGDGADNVYNKGNFTTINTGAGNDSVTNEGDQAIIHTGDGQDMVDNSGDYANIDTGADNDYIRNEFGQGTVIQTGEGKDTVFVSGNKDSRKSDGTKVTVDAVQVETGGDGDSVFNTDYSKLIIDGEEV